MIQEVFHDIPNLMDKYLVWLDLIEKWKGNRRNNDYQVEILLGARG